MLTAPKQKAMLGAEASSQGRVATLLALRPKALGTLSALTFLFAFLQFIHVISWPWWLVVGPALTSCVLNACVDYLLWESPIMIQGGGVSFATIALFSLRVCGIIQCPWWLVATPVLALIGVKLLGPYGLTVVLVVLKACHAIHCPWWLAAAPGAIAISLKPASLHVWGAIQSHAQRNS